MIGPWESEQTWNVLKVGVVLEGLMPTVQFQDLGAELKEAKWENEAWLQDKRLEYSNQQRWESIQGEQLKIFALMGRSSEGENAK